jgi:hypothetical protein
MAYAVVILDYPPLGRGLVALGLACVLAGLYLALEKQRTLAPRVRPSLAPCVHRTNQKLSDLAGLKVPALAAIHLNFGDKRPRIGRCRPRRDRALTGPQ